MTWRRLAAALLLPASLAAWSAGAAAQSARPGPAGVPGLPPTVDPAAPFVVLQDVFVLVPRGTTVHVEEVVVGQNRSDRPLHGLTFALPPGAVGAQPEQGVPPGAFRSDAAGVHLAVDAPAEGQVHVAFAFEVSRGAGEVLLPVAYPTEQLTVMVPHGRWGVAGPGLAPAGRVRLAPDVVVDAYTTLTPSAGALLPVALRPRPWVRAAAGAAALAAAAAALVDHLRRRRAARARRELELIEALARLDLARRRGEVEEGAYLQRRLHLREELRALHGG